MSSLRALRAENGRLEARIEKLEQDKVLASARAGASAPKVAPGPAAMVRATPVPVDALPPLAVVKLKPRREAAPRLATEVEVAEPAEGLLHEIQAAPSPEPRSDAPADEADLNAAEAQFERALGAMKTGDSEGGTAQMQQFVTDWPRHPKADNALYFAGLALMSARDFEAAAGVFERVLSQYPAGDAVLDSMLKVAECRLKLNRPREAKATWEKIVSTFPGTAAATQAQARLASLSTAPATP